MGKASRLQSLRQAALGVVTPIGGGTVQGVGIGTINNAKDTFGLLRDAGGKLINIATFGATNKDEAARTDSRIAGAIALGKAVVTDPVGTAQMLGEDAIRPFVEGAAKLVAGDRFGGTAQISEAASDTILNTVTGGGKAVLGAIIKSGKVPGPLGNIDLILPNANTRVLSLSEANSLTGPNRGLIYVLENSSMSARARDFRAGCTGAMCDVARRSDVAPALRFDNNVTNGNNFIRFDGIERSADGQSIVLIDRKLKLADFNEGAIRSTETTFARVAEAVRQNPGYKVVYEFPSRAALAAANNSIRSLGLQGIVTTRLTGPR